jgi:branched-chain amino acid transport system ATP-binding protein
VDRDPQPRHLYSHAPKRPGPWTVAKVTELFPRLGERLQQRSAQLSGGEQQMLAISRALLANPALLLLDEPSDGLAPAVVRQIETVLAQVRSEGIGIVLVEQDLRCAFHVAQDVRIMEKGRFVHAATVTEFRHDRPTAQRLLGVG